MIRIVVFLTIILTASFGCASAQDTFKINKSNNKVLISGKPYFIHIVKKGQTLYRIAKAYRVTVEDIENENFNIKAEGLTIGQPVKIPVKDQLHKTEVTKSKTPNCHIVDSGETAYSIAKKYHLSLLDFYSLNPQAKTTIYPGQTIFLPETPDTTTVKLLKDKEFIYHIIDSGQTFYAIATKYGLKVQQLKKVNDNIDPNNLQQGQVVKVPINHVEITDKKPDKPNKRYYYHNVKPGETIFSLANQYKIEQKQIKKHNPNLNKRDLLAGEYIKLPQKLISISENDKTLVKNKLQSTDTLIENKCDCPSNAGKNHLQVALLLPLYSYTNDTLNQNKTYQTIYPPSKIFIDFYEGVLLAVNKLSEKGLNIDLHVYDTENDTLKVQKFVNNNFFKHYNLIIGPVYSQNLPIVIEKAKKYNIPVVSPLSTSSNFLDKYNLGFQVSPTNDILSLKTLESIKYFKADNYIIIKNGNRPEEKFIRQFKETFFNGKTMKDISHLGYAEVVYYAGDKELKLDSFRDSIHNFVIVPSSDRAFVSDVISKLNTLNETHKITLFGHPRLINYNNIDVHFFHNLNTHIYNLNYIDYNKPVVNNFIYNFRKFFEKEPEKYAFYGYDITTYFLHAMQLFGEQFYCCFDNYFPELLQMEFDFKKQGIESGYINTNMIMLNFQRNYLLRPIKLTQK